MPVSIDALRRALPPPGAPLEAQVPEGGWEAVERCLGTALPADYKQFVATYGTGSAAGFVWVANPFSSKRPWFPWMSGLLHADHALRASSGGKSVSFPLFPEENGLLPWGHTDNGNGLYWITEGAPDDWAVLVSAPRGGGEDLVLATMSQFLADVISKQYRCPLFPDLAGDGAFRPLAG